MNIIISCLDTFIDNINETLCIALMDNKIIGTININYKGKTAAFFRLLYVHKDYRRKGIASTLINKACEIASNERCESIGLLLEKDNDSALMLYKKIGFICVYEYDDESKLMSKILKNY